jgi:hypothetical protein
MGQNNLSSDRNIYVKQIIEMSEESKKTLTISSDIILDETITDLKLGEFIREMYSTKLKGIEEHVKYMKSL